MGDQKNDASEFVLKLQDMMENYKDIVDWNEDQTQIIVKDLKKATEEILPKYFRHRKFQSFVRQLNMYNFYKVCRQRNNAVSFKNNIFYKGNQNNFSKIKRKKRHEFKAKPPGAPEEDASSICNHPCLDTMTKRILMDCLDLKSVSINSNRRLDELLEKLGPEMKASKFRKHDETISTLKETSQNLVLKCEEIDEILIEIKSLDQRDVSVLQERRANIPDYRLHQREQLDPPKPPSLCPATYYNSQQSTCYPPNYPIQIQTFLSITHFIGINDIINSRDRPGTQEGLIPTYLSNLSIQELIQCH